MTVPGGGQATVSPAEDAAVPESSAPNIVKLANGHTVTLHPKVTMAIGAAATAIARSTVQDAIRSAAKSGTTTPNILTAEIEGGLAAIYLKFGIMAWTFTDDKGQPEPVTPENIDRLLPYGGGGREVAEAADGLYSDDVFRPLAKQISGLLQTLPTGNSTPPTPISGSRPPKHSGQSSRNGTGGKRSAVRGR